MHSPALIERAGVPGLRFRDFCFVMMRLEWAYKKFCFSLGELKPYNPYMPLYKRKPHTALWGYVIPTHNPCILAILIFDPLKLKRREALRNSC